MDVNDEALVRGLQDERMEAPGTTVGGYAQIQANWLVVGAEGEPEGTASVRRLVLFVAHEFAGWKLPMRAYAELEWENAIAGDGAPGTAEVEQAFVEWRVAGDTLSARAGLVIVPMGIINQWHEPPVFHGVDRPTFDQTILPSTWREIGVGVVGKPGIFRYELYAMSALDPTGFDDGGIVNGRTLGAASPVDALAGAGRIELEPRPGLVLGVSGYGSDAGGAADWYDASGAKLDLSLPVLGVSADTRFRGYGLEARVVGAYWALPESDDLMEAYKADGSPYFAATASAVPTAMLGGYVEAAFNVLWFFDTEQELLPFARLEHDDSQFAVPEGATANPLRTLDEGTFGLTWRPIGGVAVKADVQLRDRRYGDDELGWNVGIGYVF